VTGGRQHPPQLGRQRRRTALAASRLPFLVSYLGASLRLSSWAVKQGARRLPNAERFRGSRPIGQSMSDIQCWFGEPIASGDRAAVEWWASWTEQGQELTFARVTVLRRRVRPYAEWSTA
jgi:hypothetical protein